MNRKDQRKRKGKESKRKERKKTEKMLIVYTLMWYDTKSSKSYWHALGACL